MEDIQKKLENELRLYKLTQNEYQKAVSTRQQLDAQLNENQVVKQELDRLPAERKVYKSIGPALIKTDIVEAKQNVSKRIDYITKEVKRIDETIGSIEKKQEVHRESLGKLQNQFQQAKMKAAIKA